jgi:O-antigen/teichoic acid export membrane protein
LSALKRFLKDTVIYGIAAVLPRAINIGLVKLHTWVFGPVSYAENTDYYVYAAYLNALLTYGMETAFFRYFSKEQEKGKIISTSFYSLLITTFVFLGTALFYSESIAMFFGFKEVLHLKILIWTVFLDTLVVIPFAYLRVTNRPIKFTVIKVANIIMLAVLNIVFLWLIPKGIVSGNIIPSWLDFYVEGSPEVIFIFIANVIASLFTLALLLPVLLKIKPQIDGSILKKLLWYGIPIMIGSLAYVTNENLDKLLLGNMLGEEQMGIYAGSYKLGVFMTLYIMAFRLGAEPFFFNHAKAVNAKQNYATILKWFTILGAVFMIIVVAYIDILAKLILGQEEFYQALAIVPIILLANLCLGIYNNLSIWYKLTDKTRYGMYISIFGALITIVFNLVMIPRIGFMASAWATLAAYGSMMLISYFLGKKHYPVAYDLKKIGFYLGLATFLSMLSFYTDLRGNYLVSSSLVLVFLGLVYLLERKDLKRLQS